MSEQVGIGVLKGGKAGMMRVLCISIDSPDSEGQQRTRQGYPELDVLGARNLILPD
ncbi:MAG: hypothetical protein ABIF19_21615 [Planctomycetota bacterium]